MSRTMRTLATALLAVMVGVVALVMWTRPADAHSGNQSYLYFEIFDTAIAGEVQFPINDLNEVLDLSIPQDEVGGLAAVEADLPVIEQYALDNIRVGDGAETWGLAFDGVRVLELSQGSYAILEFELAEEFNPAPREFVVTYSAIINEIPDRDALLIIETDWASGTFQNEASELLRYTADNQTQVVELDESSFIKGMTAVVGLGVQHIRIGTDHIMFVLALVLPAVLVFIRPRWWPAASFGSSLWRVLKIITMFTVAHSITLALGGFGIVELDPRFVETVIALSIALAALHNIRPIFPNKEWLLAFGFGLFHGFGFAGLLSELGLDRSNRVASLLGFNVGIELGQAAIILMVFPALFMLRRTRFYLGMMYAGSALLAFVAIGWALERILETDLGVSNVVDPVLAWPRAFFVIVIATVASALVYWYEDRNGRLLPTVRSVDPSDKDKVLEAV